MTEFRLALPGTDVHRGRPQDMVLDSRLDSPKIDTTASPPHAALIFLNWNRTAGIPDDTTLLLYSFPHNYNQIPIVIAAYKFDNGSNVLKGVLPFQLGGQGIITMDADEENINLKYYSIDGNVSPTDILPFIMQLRYYVMAEAGY